MTYFTGQKTGRAGTWLAEQHEFCETSVNRVDRGWVQTAVSHSGASRAQGVGSQAHHCPARPLQSEPQGHIGHSSERQGKRNEVTEWGFRRQLDREQRIYPANALRRGNYWCKVWSWLICILGCWGNSALPEKGREGETLMRVFHQWEWSENQGH